MEEVVGAAAHKTRHIQNVFAGAREPLKKDREVERHRCAATRIEQLHEDLGEPLEVIDEVNP